MSWNVISNEGIFLEGIMKRLAILGSTGSIGKSTLEVVHHLGPNHVRVVTLAAKENIDLLEQQAKIFNPQLIAVYHPGKAKELQKRLPKVKVVGGMEGLEEAAIHTDVNLVLSAISGNMGLKPTIAAIRAGKDIALATKEVLVSAGSFVMNLVAKNKVNLIPVDSEHSAIFQCLQGQPKDAIRQLILTASGGPFRSYTPEQISKITLSDALNHPTWRMGPKVTVDCSTLMNKGLEMIEAYWLFGVPSEKIKVIVHPQSIIHSIVEFTDNSMLAQMGEPSMKTPIQYAITYPERTTGSLKPFDFLKSPTLQFFEPDQVKFPCLRLAFEAIEKGGSLPCYLNAANEILVERFLNKKLGWGEIAVKLERLMNRHNVRTIESLDDVHEVDKMARAQAINE